MRWVLRGDQAKKETEGPAAYLWGKPVYSQETEWMAYKQKII